MRPLGAHLDELTAKHIDIDVRRCQNDMLDLRGIDLSRMATPRSASAASQPPME